MAVNGAGRGGALRAEIVGIGAAGGSYPTRVMKEETPGYRVGGLPLHL